MNSADDIPESLEEVFVTDGFPSHSYVDADGGKAERELRDGLAIANKVVSIVGPSKCGKTTLCDHVFGTQRGSSKILVAGDSFKTADEFWANVLSQTPCAGDYPDRLPPRDVIADIVTRSEMPIVIDDFHYIEDRDLQRNICQQIKSTAAAGVRFIVLSPRHRGDDPIRNNPDLSGRFFSVDLTFWTPDTLAQIASIGFGKLGIELSDGIRTWLANEALGSPQLMQTLCLETGRAFLKIDMPFREQLIDEALFKWEPVRTRALRSYDHSTMYQTLKSGPPRRGQARNEYTLKNGKPGDVYDVLCLTLGTNPPFSAIDVDGIRGRAMSVLAGDSKPNFPAALEQLNALFTTRHRPLEYDEETRTVSIVDPHFYFFLRAKAAAELQ